MKMNNNYTNRFFDMLQSKIEMAEKEKQPIDDFVKKQIELLMESHDEFLSLAKKEGHNLNNPAIGEIEIKQFSAMKQLAQKIGIPIEKYDEMIKQVRERMFGADGTKEFFGKK